jgi:hypothetical protein
MSTPAQQQAARLRAIAEHLSVCPHLTPVIVHERDLQIGHGIDRLAALLAWAASMTDTTVRMQALGRNDLIAYVYADGWLGDHQDTVWTTVDGLVEYLGITEQRDFHEIALGDLEDFAEFGTSGGELR